MDTLHPLSLGRAHTDRLFFLSISFRLPFFDRKDLKMFTAFTNGNNQLTQPPGRERKRLQFDKRTNVQVLCEWKHINQQGRYASSAMPMATTTGLEEEGFFDYFLLRFVFFPGWLIAWMLSSGFKDKHTPKCEQMQQGELVYANPQSRLGKVAKSL